MKNLALILAGGSGNRMGAHLPKQFLQLSGKTIIQHTIEKFENHPSIHDIFIVTNGEFIDQTRDLVQESGFEKVTRIMEGGAQRQDSSRIGILAARDGNFDNVLIHDAARPFVTASIIDNVLKALDKYQAVNVGIPSSDTIVEVNNKNTITNVPNRDILRRVQTPQAFKYPLIANAHLEAVQKGKTNASDDCSLIMEFSSQPVYVVQGSQWNIKITLPSDLDLAEKIFQLQNASSNKDNNGNKGKIWKIT